MDEMDEFRIMYQEIMKVIDELHSSIDRTEKMIDEIFERDIREAQEAESQAFEMVGRAQLLLDNDTRNLDKIKKAKKLLHSAECKFRDTFFPPDENGNDDWEAENKQRADIVAKMLHRAYALERFCK